MRVPRLRQPRLPEERALRKGEGRQSARLPPHRGAEGGGGAPRGRHAHPAGRGVGGPRHRDILAPRRRPLRRQDHVLRSGGDAAHGHVRRGRRARVPLPVERGREGSRRAHPGRGPRARSAARPRHAARHGEPRRRRRCVRRRRQRRRKQGRRGRRGRRRGWRRAGSQDETRGDGGGGGGGGGEGASPFAGFSFAPPSSTAPAAGSPFFSGFSLLQPAPDAGKDAAAGSERAAGSEPAGGGGILSRLSGAPKPFIEPFIEPEPEVEREEERVEAAAKSPPPFQREFQREAPTPDLPVRTALAVELDL
mmetsp:Transcript_10813/g.45017  ORF Transcript_10813/g.45017 Transcript_10813/m.45017 type:complete len:307 (+) Transcript_10813:2302-3222(+)